MNELKVLDHGSVKLLNIAGPVRRADRFYDADSIDPAITARISFDEMGSVRTRDDELRLLKYLMKNKHNTPVEMIECYFEMRMPIFVARQFVRHRTACINEVSGRYVQLPEEWYIPDVVAGKPTDGAKQGRSDNLDPAIQECFQLDLDAQCSESYRLYEEKLALGVAPEQARMFLHLNHYTHWVWKQDLSNLLHFLALRDHSHAQFEAREYAKAITVCLRNAIPDLMQVHDELQG